MEPLAASSYSRGSLLPCPCLLTHAASFKMRQGRGQVCMSWPKSSRPYANGAVSPSPPQLWCDSGTGYYPTLGWPVWTRHRGGMSPPPLVSLLTDRVVADPAWLFLFSPRRASVCTQLGIVAGSMASMARQAWDFLQVFCLHSVMLRHVPARLVRAGVDERL